MKNRRVRSKTCDACGQVCDTLFRARAETGVPWRFYCVACLPQIKANNPAYIYGGTWKSKKRN